MKKLAAILFLFFCFQRVYSQENILYNKAKLDSIQHLLNSNKTDDTTAVKRLNYLARIYFSNFEYDSGLKATKQARLLAKQLKYKKGEGLYYRTLAVFYLNTTPKYYYNRKAGETFAELKQKEDNFEIEIPEPNDKLIKKGNSQISSSLYFFEKEDDKEITPLHPHIISTVTFASPHHFNSLVFGIFHYEKLDDDLHRYNHR